MREGILCWYPFEAGANILDCSDGVLTDMLKARNCFVSFQRKDSLFFDYIIILDPTDFDVSTLESFRKRLGEHGRLLLAYENPFALRYWAGHKAQNTGRPYDTLTRTGKDPLPSKAELSSNLKIAGFKGQKWYYPLTDHWFAREIYSDNYLPNKFFNQRFVPYIDCDSSLTFDERALYRSIISEGAFTFMCGAYLVESRVCEADIPCTVDYASVTAYRGHSKCYATTVRNDNTVRKIPLYKDSEAGVRAIYQNHMELKSLGVPVIDCEIENNCLVMPRISMPTLWDYWAEKFCEGALNVKGMIKQFDRIKEYIYKSAKYGKCYWEMVPANCFYNYETDELLFFDQEFCWQDADPDIAVARMIMSIKFSEVFSKDPMFESVFEDLREYFGLKKKWSELVLAMRKTYDEVFNPEATTDLDLATQNSIETISLFRLKCKLEYLRLSELKHIAIYGYGVRGKRLERAIKDLGLRVACVMDQGFKDSRSISEIANASSADVILVSIKNGISIADDIRRRVEIPVLLLDEL
jgi:hypothetical protein